VEKKFYTTDGSRTPDMLKQIYISWSQFVNLVEDVIKIIAIYALPMVSPPCSG
jgi:hypothetical protein